MGLAYRWAAQTICPLARRSARSMQLSSGRLAGCCRRSFWISVQSSAHQGLGKGEGLSLPLSDLEQDRPEYPVSDDELRAIDWG